MTKQTPKRLQGDSKREAAWLLNRGYDGLYAAGECACECSDLYPCGERQDDCRPGYKGNCTDACEHEGAGEGNWHISANKPAVELASSPPRGSHVGEG